jgi:aspartyl-tRNA(Asn)/glutamyl-tRNA(Gln) amidotransferase subunit A
MRGARPRSSGLSGSAADPPNLGSVASLVAGLGGGDLDPIDVADEHLRRLAAGSWLNAFLWTEPDRLRAAIRRAALAERPLAGLPIVLKDNIDTAGIPTTSGSLVDGDRVPTSDASVWRRLRDTGGATLLGKAHMSEYAYRSHHPTLGWVRNPRDPDRATGGSSSGSAAAVAAGIAAAALGTDTGGSVRIPAAYCGVVGLKGTFGLVENDGIVPLSPRMDHVGVLARSVADAAIVFEQMTARPVRLTVDGTLKVRAADPLRLRVGVERGYFSAGAQPAVARTWSSAAAALATAGCRVVDISLPRASRWRAAHKRVLIRDAWDEHAERIRAGAPYGPVFRTAISAGARIGERELAAALDARREAADTLARVFEAVDVILTPTCPTVAPAVEEGRRTTAYTRYTTLAAFIGLPAISIPAGTGYLGLPIGLQLMAARNDEPMLVAAAALLERVLASEAAGRPGGGAGMSAAR